MSFVVGGLPFIGLSVPLGVNLVRLAASVAWLVFDAFVVVVGLALAKLCRFGTLSEERWLVPILELAPKMRYLVSSGFLMLDVLVAIGCMR